MFKNKKSLILEKDGLMFIIIIGIWIIILLHFDPKILSYLHKQNSFLAKTSIFGFIVCVNIFWLYCVYHLVIAFFSSFLVKPKRLSFKPMIQSKQRIAILYLTMNDFREEAMLSCINQEYSNFDVYILDDSTDIKWKNRVNNFIQKRHKVKLIRRNSRKNYKAGNLNNALEKIYKDYDYFAVSDADGILPTDFLKNLLPYFNVSENVGFVQGNQHWNSKQDSEFAHDLGLNTDMHWQYYVPAKNKYGFLMFYGHGAIIKSDVWKEAGGFPNTVTEDIAFSSILREKGYVGIFVPNVICLEDFPHDYKSFRTRNERWVKGTTEYLYTWYPRLLFSDKVYWFEKLDILLSAGVLLQPFIFIIFLLIVSLLLPATARLFGLHIPLVAAFVPFKEMVATYFSGVYFYTSWSFEFFLLMTITAFAQFASLTLRIIREPIKVARYMGSFVFVCLAVSIATFVNILVFLASERSEFLVTGSKQKKFTLEHWLVICFEIIFGIFLAFSVINTGNIWLLTIVVALLLNPFAYRLKWSNPIFNLLVFSPLILMFLIILIISASLL